jgi:transcriptional regulator with XRE-family HTH domain
MNAEQYRTLRQSIGSQNFVAQRLGIDPQTLSNRERAVHRITKEQEFALLHLQLQIWEEVGV